jgi:hypothetical protein
VTGPAESENDGDPPLHGGAEAIHGRRRVPRAGNPADHVDREGVYIGTGGANHLEGGGDLRFAEVELEIDHAGDAEGGRELIDGVGRHAGAVRDDEDAAAPAGSPLHGLGAEERDVEVVALAAEDEQASAFLALAAQEDVGQGLVLEAGLGDAVVELAEHEQPGSRQLFLGHSPNRSSRSGRLVARGRGTAALPADGKIHTLQGSTDPLDGRKERELREDGRPWEARENNAVLRPRNRS